MVTSQLLRVGRAIGLENVGQIRQLVRAARNGAQEASIHLNLPQPNLSEITSRICNLDDKLLAELQKMYPQDSKNIITILFKKFSEKSGKVSMRTVTQAATGENIADFSLNTVANSAGFRTVAKGTSSAPKMSFDMDYTDVVGLNHQKANWWDNILKNLKISTKNGMYELNIPQVKGNGTSIKYNLAFGEDFGNEVTRIATNGKYNNFGEIVKEAGLG